MKILVHVEDMNNHHRKAIGFTGTTSEAVDAKMNIYFADRPHLRIVCVDEAV